MSAFTGICKGDKNRITLEIRSSKSDLLSQFQSTYRVVLISCSSENLYSYNNTSRIQTETSSTLTDEGIVIEVLGTDLEENMKTLTIGLELVDPNFKPLKSGATTVTWKGTTQQRSGSVYHQPGSYYEHIGYKTGYTNCWVCSWHWTPDVSGYYYWLYRSATVSLCLEDEDKSTYKIGFQINAENHSSYTYVVNFSSAGC